MRAGADPPWFSLAALGRAQADAHEPTPPTTEGERPTVAFVLEGGGSYGASQIGMLNALVDAGIIGRYQTWN